MATDPEVRCTTRVNCIALQYYIGPVEWRGMDSLATNVCGEVLGGNDVHKYKNI